MSQLPLRFVINRVGEPTLMEYGAAQCPLDSPQAVRDFWTAVISARSDHEPDKELLAVIILNAKLRPTGYHVVAIGSLNECLAHPREILRPVIVSAAHAMILSHNHPSGEPTGISATASDSRSQFTNRQLALERFLDVFEKQRTEKRQHQLAEISKKWRQKAKRSLGTQRKLVEGKRHRGETKKMRGKVIP